MYLADGTGVFGAQPFNVRKNLGSEKFQALSPTLVDYVRYIIFFDVYCLIVTNGFRVGIYKCRGTRMLAFHEDCIRVGGRTWDASILPLTSNKQVPHQNTLYIHTFILDSDHRNPRRTQIIYGIRRNPFPFDPLPRHSAFRRRG